MNYQESNETSILPKSFVPENNTNATEFIHMNQMKRNGNPTWIDSSMFRRSFISDEFLNSMCEESELDKEFHGTSVDIIAKSLLYSIYNLPETYLSTELTSLLTNRLWAQSGDLDGLVIEERC